MSSTTKRRTKRPQRSTAEQVAGKEEQRRTAWRDVERAAQAKGDWPWLFGLRDAVGAADLVALWDRALEALAERLGLEPFPPGDTPAMAFLNGRRSRWHDHLEERLVTVGARDLFHDALQEFAKSVGFPLYSPNFVATQVPPAQAAPIDDGGLEFERHT